MQVVEFGVREFLNITLKSGGLSAEFMPRSRAAEGVAAHVEVTGKRPEGYQPEVSIKHAFVWEQFKLVLSGRIDGVHETLDEVVVEEIKSTFLPLERLDPEDHPYHLAQLQLYHHFYCSTRPTARVVPVLTYVNPVTLEERSFRLEWTPEESAAFFELLAVKLLQKELEARRWRAVRDKSLRQLDFPFPTPRPGQQELVAAVEAATRMQHDLLAEAATGIGKSMGVLYPALRGLALKRGYRRVFFLTAKTAGVEAAAKAVARLRAQGLRLRVLYLTAKDRVCPYPAETRPDCQEGDCPFADAFFDRVEPVVAELLTHEDVTPELIAAAATEHQLCPFELALELSLEVDLIVGDYNYAFDPGAYLRRFFWPGLPNNNLFLIDEAHNLVARSREMYSANLDEAAILHIRKLFGQGRDQLAWCLNNLLGFFGHWRDEIELEGGNALKIETFPEDLPTWVEGTLDCASELLMDLPKGPRRRQLLEFYFELAHFSRIADGLTRDYAVFVMTEARQLRLRLFCLHPGALLRQRLERSTAAVFFSATLSPASYFRDLLGARPGASQLSLPSPFPPEHRLYLHVPDVSTRFRARESTRPSVAQVILQVARAHSGNYLAFFPSYAYLGTVWAELMLDKPQDVAIHVQKPGLTRAQQAEFLLQVCTVGARGNIGLAVMGGLFGEAVDLPGEQLIGTIIVGPGLPGLSLEQQLLGEYFDEERDGAGFFYASVVPGLTRVIQAAGRVFRTTQDTGVVVLIDDRFLQDPYRSLLPPDWNAADPEFSRPDYQNALAEFWASLS